MTSTDQDDIPTLDKIVFPGRAEAEQEALRIAAEEATKNPQVDASPDTTQTEISRKRLAFEQELAHHIDLILAKHMAAARREILQTVLQDLRARLPEKQNEK